ncbi:MAG: hypothetical protein QNJ98_13845 [Planctomycetota bacterium]|nr:hypothetical protein [Planctomycetota bacterium]
MTTQAAIGESGLTELALAPQLRLSLEKAQELLALLERMPGGEAIEMHWQADEQSPKVQVAPHRERFDSAVDALVQEVGGFGPLDDGSAGWRERVGTTPARVLVVTADQTIQEIAVGFLNVMGLDPVAVDAGYAAVNRVEAREYDVLLIGSTRLGDVDIKDVLSALKPYLAMTTPVLFWTGDAYTDIHELATDLGTPLRVLTKPNDFEGFRRAVREALEWRHLFRMRRHVARYVREEVARQVRQIETDLFGAPLEAPSPSHTPTEATVTDPRLPVLAGAQEPNSPPPTM